MKKMLVFLSFLLLVLVSHSVSVAAGPSLTVASPKEGAIIRGSDVTAQFEASSDFKIVPSSVPADQLGKRPDLNKPGEGHYHLMLDLQPLVILYNSEPYTFNNVPPGRHQLMVELVNNDHSSLSPPVVRNISFEISGSLPQTGVGFYQWAQLLITILLLTLVLVTRALGYWPDQRYAEGQRVSR